MIVISRETSKRIAELLGLPANTLSVKVNIDPNALMTVTAELALTREQLVAIAKVIESA